jgi:hypothetical protein
MVDFRFGPDKKDRLRTRVDGRRLEREMTLMRVYERQDRERAIKEALDIVPNLEFWCDKCSKDFIGQGYKVRLVLPVKDKTPIGYWYGYCPQRHYAVRRITDKSYDPYYLKSKMVLAQAIQYADDLLTPDDPRFALRYPKEYERYITDNGERPDINDAKLL